MAITCDHTAVIDQIFVDNREFFIHRLHSTHPLTLVVLSWLDRGIQSTTEILPFKTGCDVAYDFNCTPAFCIMYMSVVPELNTVAVAGMIS